MFLDTHCHLNFNQYDEDRAMVLGNAKKAGVKQFINPGVDLLSSREAIALAKKYPRVVYAAIGIHPYEAQHDPDVNDLEKLLYDPPSRSQSSHLGRRPKASFQVKAVVAIGECGLDYHQYKGEQAAGKKDKQKRLFEEQLRLALTHNLPVIMHCRDGTSNVPAASSQTRLTRLTVSFDGGAYEDFFNVIDTLPSLPRGVIHCFSGGLQEVRMAKERKFFVGIDGNVTYSKHLETIVPSIPLSMLLLETDAPYLTPVPHRGTRNEPKFIPIIAKKIAELQHTSVGEIAERTTTNAMMLFSIR